MANYSDMNSFPESGFPVLSDVSDRIVLNALYTNPLKPLGFVIDVVGANRLSGALAIAGALSGVTTIGMSGALSGATDISMGGLLTGVTDLGVSGSVGSIMARVNKGWFKDLEVKNTPTVNGEPIALISDISRCFNSIDVVDASLMEYQGIVDDMLVNLNFYPDKSTVIVGNLGLFGNTAVGQRLKANYNNWATLADVVQALVDLHLFDEV
jgi:hypothetical protein